MTWSTCTDVHEFLAAAGGFLEAAPVDHTVLLTEAAYRAARPTRDADQLYGWWQSAGGLVAGAFLQAPGHRPVLSIMPLRAVESLVELMPDLPPIGVDSRLVGPVVTAWRDRAGSTLSERSRIRLCRLDDRARFASQRPGRARIATGTDRGLLVRWFRQLMAAYPDDPTELSYVVDDPIA
jgi:hypothetical protein